MSRRTAVALLTSGTGLFVAIVRFLATRGYPDDHYIHLAGAQQMLFGGWPSRDFVDLGAPLQYAASAAVMAVFGESLFTETVFVATMFGLAAALTFRGVVDLTGSIAFALVAVAVELAAFPRSYGYPKVILYVVGALAMWRYIASPSYQRMVLLALLVVLAFLMRHDHALALGAGGAAAVVLAPGPWRQRATRLGAYVAIGLALVLPYLIYLSMHGGLQAHLEGGLAISALERNRTALTLPWFTMDGWTANTVPVLFWAVWALPFLAFVLAPRERRTWVAPLAIVAMLANVAMLRDALSVRLPDVMAPAALLLGGVGAWLWHAGHGGRLAVPARIAAVAIVALVFGATAHIGEAYEQFDRAGFYGGVLRLPGRLIERTGELRERLSPRQIPSASVEALLPFFAYADRCLGGEDRVLVPDFLPEIAVWARRPFAGGQVVFQQGMLRTARDHRLVMERLGRERVPVAVYRPERFTGIAGEFPELAAYLERFSHVETFAVPGHVPVVVRFDPSHARGHDAATGWPCYR
jgi:hypothetical protein